MSEAVTIASFFAANKAIIPLPQPNSKKVLLFKSSVWIKSNSILVLNVKWGGKTLGWTWTQIES